MNSAARILIVDDYPGNTVVADIYLKDLGYDTAVAHDGEDAVSAVLEQRFDAVLMDIEMPRMNGYDATRAIREAQKAGKTGAVCIIGMSAHHFKEERDKCLEAGMDDFMTKPYEPAALKDILSRHIKAA